jgi:hypothetical protein
MKFQYKRHEKKSHYQHQINQEQDYELTVLHIWNEFTYPAYLEAVKKRGSIIFKEQGHDIKIQAI